MQPREHKATILVVEDDPAILRGLLDVFVFNGYSAAGVEDGGQGLVDCLQGNHDLIILDVMLPSVDGFTICKAIRQAKPQQAIMMLTAKGAEDDVIQGFQAGADDYVSKPFSLRELLVRVEALLRRVNKHPAEQSVTLGPILFDATKLLASSKEQKIEITRREMEIISYLWRHRGRIISKAELLEKVWNYAATDLETRTVDIHIQKLRKKISHLTGDKPLIVTIRGEGYRLETDC